MSEKRFEPERSQIVSDLGQLKALTQPAQARMLRILQKQEATMAQLVSLTGESEASTRSHLDALMQAGLVREIGDTDGAPSYRAGARYYGFRPDPSDLEMVAGPLTLALLQVVGQELGTSMTTWPGQRMSGQLRRARLSPGRLVEFEDRLEALIEEFWGSPDRPVVEKDGDPVMSLASVVYRYPEDED